MAALDCGPADIEGDLESTELSCRVGGGRAADRGCRTTELGCWTAKLGCRAAEPGGAVVSWRAEPGSLKGPIYNEFLLIFSLIVSNPLVRI